MGHCSPCGRVTPTVTSSASSAGGFVNNWGKAITPKGNSFESGVWLTLWTRDVPPPDPVGEQISEGDVQEWTVRGFLDAL